ncbi:uncharacterized protein [Nicotiana sylvestris]|uniref:uncharacterized protein n=1 Tax=Nicotiana sylvestris TaxID=4096 RepID=UPI00388CABC2
MKLNPEKCAFGVASALKKQDHFEWNEECQHALRNLKMYLSNPPLLAKPKAGERLLIYLAVSEVAVSAVLVREDQAKQSPIYYVSKYLLDAETRYPQLEKLALALIMASRKLKPYFQCHPIAVVTAYPLRNILHKHELSGRLAKWAIKLSEYEITYEPRTSIKSQVLADFVADFSQGMQLEAEKELQVFNGANPGIWTLFTDGLSNVKGLELARELSINQITIKSNSKLVVNQMLGTYTAREARMQQYLAKVRDLLKQFQTWKVTLIPRDENVDDSLTNLASAVDVASNKNASVIHLFHSVLDLDKNEYGTVLEDKRKAHALRKKATRYCLKQGNLYRKMFGGPLARCLGPSQTEYIGEPSTRFTQATEESNDEEMRVNLDLLEGRREVALIRMASQKQVIEQYYNRRARLIFFKIGDFVLKKVFQSTKTANAGKLSPTWEGPYRIRDIACKRAYELETMDGKILPSHWNVVHLKRYYFYGIPTEHQQQRAQLGQEYQQLRAQLDLQQQARLGLK